MLRINKGRCQTPHSYISVHLKEFFDACSVDFCHWRALLYTLIVVSHILPARCKYVTPFGYPLPGHDIISIHFHELLMNISCQHFCAHRKHVTRTDKWDQLFKWVTMLNFCSCASSVHMPGVTWLWALEPSVIMSAAFENWRTLHIELNWTIKFFYPSL